MWVFLNDSFISVVGTGFHEKLLVRGRLPGDIERVFPKAEVQETPDRDYRFRTFVTREEMAGALYNAVFAIDYPNFKGSVADPDRHDAYLDVWDAMLDAQQRKLGMAKTTGR